MSLNLLLIDAATPSPEEAHVSLVDAGFAVLRTTSGPDALALLQSQEITVVVMALNLPGLDAYALAQQIHGVERTRYTPIIFLAASDAEVLSVFRGDATGMSDVVLRSASPVILLNKVRLFAGLSSQRRQLELRTAESDRLARLNALMIGTLLHDMRTPLAALTLNGELVIRRAEVPSVQLAGTRIKAATAMLSRQVEHLVSLATIPSDDLRPLLSPVDLAQITQQRIDAAAKQPLLGTAVSLQTNGDIAAELDAALIARAIDQLLLVSAMHGEGQPVQVQVDGGLRRALVLRVSFDTVIGDAARQHLFGGGAVEAGLPSPNVGPGLHLAERIARSHGGSLIGRSRDAHGTLIEMMLPRGID